MEKKAMFFDIDGTLLPSGGKEFTPSALEAIRQAKANGHLMFINTGRVVANLEDFMFDPAFNGFVCACGTYILIDGEVKLYVHTPDDVCSRVRELADKYSMDIVFESHHGIYCDRDKLVTEGCRSLVNTLFKRGQINLTIPEGVLNFDKFVTWERRDSALSDFVEAVSPYYDYIDRRGGFGEYVPKGYSKATGIQFILDHYNVPIENAYAVGDSTNDLPMLKFVPHSIAMGNSFPQSLFDEVEYVTDDIDSDGIKNALIHYGFI
ncbi:MAG: HAD hydrolase family protein [Lachnospiraceae bacterium]|nr:HAD hydrolase family protein [Lachnospiraceae bacterium]